MWSTVNGGEKMMNCECDYPLFMVDHFKRLRQNLWWKTVLWLVLKGYGKNCVRNCFVIMGNVCVHH